MYFKFLIIIIIIHFLLQNIFCYTISNCAALNSITNMTGNYFLISNIDCIGVNFNSIGSASRPWMGFFDGGGHTISNLTVRPSSSPAGLFSCAKSATVQNVLFKDFSICSSYLDSGFLFGTATGCTVTNVTLSSSGGVNSVVSNASGKKAKRG